MNESDKDAVIKALVKRAVGYKSEETSEEYAVDGDGEIKLLKRRVVEKETPADVTASKLLLALCGETDVSALSDEELFALCETLEKELKE